MKAVIQRVLKASVTVDSEVIGSIGPGFLVLLGVTHHDSEADAETLARKTHSLRIFEDDEGRMNRSLSQTGGEALVISQFTLYADTRKGNRPSFVQAALPESADKLYRQYVKCLEQHLGPDRVETGSFGAYMQVELINDGPVTIELSTDNKHA